MGATSERPDWSVTDEKMAEAVQRIIDAANPSRIIFRISRSTELRKIAQGAKKPPTIAGIRSLTVLNSLKT